MTNKEKSNRVVKLIESKFTHKQLVEMNNRYMSMWDKDSYSLVKFKSMTPKETANDFFKWIIAEYGLTNECNELGCWDWYKLNYTDKDLSEDTKIDKNRFKWR